MAISSQRLRKLLLLLHLLSFELPLAQSSYSSKYRSSSSKYVEYDGQLQFTNCDDSVVRLTYLSVLCDSPYTFYYGNGANRKSAVCDYGDKATISVAVQVVDDLQEGDTIFVTMAMYDDADNLLVSTSPAYLCQKYIGFECATAGIYSFTTQLKFGTPTEGNRTKFLPTVQMAFSTKSDSGYNLGAVNTECKTWDQNKPSYVSWSDETSGMSPIRTFFSEYGILLGVGVCFSLFGAFLLKQSQETEEFTLDYHRNHVDEMDDSSGEHFF